MCLYSSYLSATRSDFSYTTCAKKTQAQQFSDETTGAGLLGLNLPSIVRVDSGSRLVRQAPVFSFLNLLSILARLEMISYGRYPRETNTTIF